MHVGGTHCRSTNKDSSSESVLECVIVLSQAVPGESDRMLLTNEIPHVNCGKLMSFDCVICLSLLDGCEQIGTEPVTNWHSWDSHTHKKNKVAFAKSYLAYKMNRTCFSVKGARDTKQATVLYLATLSRCEDYWEK